MHRDQALQLVYDAIDSVNPLLPQSRRLAKAPETILVGPSGQLDSLGIINFLLALEERASDAAGTPVQLLDDTALIAEHARFRTVDALARYLEALGQV
jgi:acyl carrier protein